MQRPGLASHHYATLAGALALACCAPPPPPPSSTPPPIERPAPAPAPVAVQPSYDNWLDAPQTPGDWQYGQAGNRTLASYREPGGATLFTLACNRTSGVLLQREGTASGAVPMRIRTETQDRLLSAQPANAGGPVLVASVMRGDGLLDAMALSRGRFAVEVTGQPTLYLPAWAEVSRVIEDCR